ncbi:hypothetical protein N9355_05830 [Crocinitomicaceae bacterium]|nr:hypothetical protein [Crocinitomicaceae bacterium]
MRILLALLLICNGIAASAQSSKLKQGMVSFELGNYEEAVSQLSEAMDAPVLLKAKEVPEGWFYLGKSKSILISNAMSLQNQEQLVRYKGYDLEAYECFNKAIKADAKDQITQSSIQEIQDVSYVIFNSGNTEYLLGNLDDAITYYNAAESIAESHGMRGDYQIYSLRGQTYLSKGDSTLAYNDFAKATERYLASSPEIPDANIGYAYYSMAIIERYNNNDLDRALELAQVGNELMQSEVERMKGLLNNGSSDQSLLASQGAQFGSIMDALNRFELDIYSTSPQKYDEAVAKFKKALIENPGDANMWLVYGNLIEYNDIEGSYEAYRNAIVIDPNNSVAHFNAGANRVNKGTSYARKANDEIDFQKAQEWQDKMNEEFKKALPHMEKAHELEPNNIYVLDALIQVTLQLEMMDDYNLYKEKQQLLKGY